LFIPGHDYLHENFIYLVFILLEKSKEKITPKAMKNKLVADIFNQVAEILEIKQENPFRIRAYQKAALSIDALSQPIEDLVFQDDFKLAGIGPDLAEKIKEIVQTGKLKFYEDLKKEIPQGLVEILQVPGIGPRTAKLVYDKLGVKDVAGLEKAARSHLLASLPGMGEKSEENIIRGIELVKKHHERMTIASAMSLASGFVFALEELPEVKRIEVAGSLRRHKDTVRDIDILLISQKPEKVMRTFASLPQVGQVQAEGPTKASILTKTGVQVDVRVVQAKSFGAALLYFTGSKNFNIKLREMAVRRGLKINEYGVFRKEKYLAGKSEAEIFKLFKMPYLEPELREDNGEIEAALENKLPKLIELKDVKGDFHVHSKYSDGVNSILEVAEAAKKRGYRYVAITDHSQGLKVAGGLSLADLKRKRSEIERVNKKISGIKILFGTEVDIDAEGKLDYPDSTLKELDVVVAAIHSGFSQRQEQLTKRIIRAMENKYVQIISHPTGRLRGQREAYEIDLEAVLRQARKTHTALEINSFPERLDLNDIHCRRAKEVGAKIAINTDAHTIGQLEYMQYGVFVARRGWLEKQDVLNCLSLEALMRELGRKRT
jgi:DNA polymerase (family 10)